MKEGKLKEVIFKGKRIIDGQWVYGNFFYWRKYGKDIPIIGHGVQNGSMQGFEIDPKTKAIHKII